MKINLAKILMAALLFAASYAQAQVSVTKGKLHKMSLKGGAWSDLTPIGNDENGYYYLLLPFSEVYSGAYIGSKDYYVGRVNPDLSFGKIEVLPLTFDGKDMDFEFAMEYQGKSLVFTSFQNNQLKKTFLFAQTIDRSTLLPSGDLQKVAEIDYSMTSKYKKTRFDFKLSEDKQKLLIIHNLKDKDNSLLSFGFTVLDQSLQEVSKVNGVSLTGEGIYSFQEYQLANDGTVYLSAQYFEDRKELKDAVEMEKQGFLSGTRAYHREANYDYKLLKFKGAAIPQEIDLTVPGAFLSSVTYAPSSKGVLCVGFYSADDDALPEGAVTLTINSAGKIIATDQQPFEVSFAQSEKYTNGTYKPQGVLNKADDLTDYRFLLKDLIKRPSGGYVLAAERLATIEQTVNNGRTYSVYNIYHTDDIAVVDVAPDGKINWQRKIVKAQETSGLGTLYRSFELGLIGDDLRLFFADIASQNFKMIGKVVDTSSRVVSVDPSGAISDEEVFTASGHKITLKPDPTYVTDDGSTILYGHNGLFYVGFVKVD